MASLIHRVVLFKFASADEQTQVLKAIEKLGQDNSKVCTVHLPRHTKEL